MVEVLQMSHSLLHEV